MKGNLDKSQIQNSELYLEQIYVPENFAAVYARKSTKMDNLSLISQEDLGTEMLQKEGLILYKVYKDSESATKKNLYERDGMRNLLEDAKAGKFKTLIVFRLDRLARYKKEQYEIKRILKMQGVRILYSEPNAYQPKDDMYSEFIEEILMTIAEYEPKNINKRTTIGKKKQWEDGLYDRGGKLPYGFNYDKVNKVLKLNGKRSKVIKEIFSRCRNINEKYKAGNIANELNELKITEDEFDGPKITRIIRNPIYGGVQPNRNGDLLSLFVEDENGDFILNPDLRRFNNVITFTTNSDEAFELWKEGVTQWRKHYNTRSPYTTNYFFKDLVYCSKCNSKISISGVYCKCINNCFRFPIDKLTDELLKHILSDLIEKNANSTIEKNIKKSKEEIKNLKNILDKHINQKQKFILGNIDDLGNQHIRSEINKLIDIEENYKDNIYKHEKMIQGLKGTLKNIDSIKLYGTMDEVTNSFREDTNVQEDLVNIINKIYISIEESKYSNRNKKVHIEVIEYGTK